MAPTGVSGFITYRSKITGARVYTLLKSICIISTEQLIVSRKALARKKKKQEEEEEEEKEKKLWNAPFEISPLKGNTSGTTR